MVTTLRKRIFRSNQSQRFTQCFSLSLECRARGAGQQPKPSLPPTPASGPHLHGTARRVGGRAGGWRAVCALQPTASPLPEEPVTRPPPWEGRRGSGCTLGPEPEPRSDTNPAVGLIA